MFKSKKLYGALVFLTGFAAAAVAVSAGASVVRTKDAFRAAQPGQRTYELGDLRIEHPFEESTALAGVGYTASWSEGGYPGVAQCRITLTDERGRVVGQSDFSLDSASAEFVRPVGERVPVDGDPATGRAQCTQGNYNPNSSRARFETRSMSPSSNRYHPGADNDRAEITFDVDWPGEGGQFMRICRVIVKHEDGTESGGEPFTTNLGEGPVSYDVFVGEPQSFESAVLRCEDFQG